MQNNQHLLAFSITAYYRRLEFWISIRIVSLKGQIKIQMKVLSRNFDWLIFKLKSLKEKHLDVQLCSMTSINLGKMCIYFPKLLSLLKCHENVVSFSKTTQNKVSLFPWKCPFCYALFNNCLYFLNKLLEHSAPFNNTSFGETLDSGHIWDSTFTN